MNSHAEALQQAVRLLQAHRTDEAERLIEGVLRQSPNDADALTLLGLAYAQRNDNARAAELLTRASTLNPHNLTAQINRAKVLTKLERWAEVADAAGVVLASHAGHVEARRLRGQALAGLKRDAEALTDLDAVTTDNVATLLVRAKLRYAAGRADAAIEDYDRILGAVPAHWEALNNRGIALEAAQRYDDALASYERALAINPANTSILHNRAAVLLTLRRPEEALPLFAHLTVLEPAVADNWTGHAAALSSLVQLDEARASFDKALALDANAVRALIGRGTIFAALGHTSGALADYRRALAIEPTNATAHTNLAFALLADGNLTDGFAEYEWRRNDGPIHLTARRFEKPEWQGEDIAGRTLLLHPEQGLGDILQFARFVPRLAAKGVRVIIEVPAALESLMQTLPGNADVVRTGSTPPHFDLHAPLMSLGRNLELSLKTVATEFPYLQAPADRLSAWKARTASLRRPRIGLCWSGNPAHANDRARSIPLAEFARIANAPNVTFVNLQRDLRDSDKDAFSAMSGLADFMPHVADLADTAALIGELDLVICVDTSVAHLAGALGKPVLILLATSADWRWLKDRDDSPWYPTARLYRQTKHNDWTDPIARLRADLAARYPQS